jgi:hypothetical protein
MSHVNNNILELGSSGNYKVGGWVGGAQREEYCFSVLLSLLTENLMNIEVGSFLHFIKKRHKKKTGFGWWYIYSTHHHRHFGSFLLSLSHSINIMVLYMYIQYAFL